MSKNNSIDKELVIIAGPNGSGKSTLASNLVLPKPFINADMYAKNKYAHIANEQERAILSSFAVAQKIKECIALQKSFAFETVFAVDKLPQFVLAAKKNNYYITLHFVALENVLNNIERVAKRVSQGGHNIATDLIKTRHSKTMALLPQLLSVSDRAILYDNTGKSMLPFLVKEENEFKILDDIPTWALATLGQLQT